MTASPTLPADGAGVRVHGAPPLSKYLLEACWAPSTVLGPGDSAVSSAVGDPVLVASRSGRGPGGGSGHSHYSVRHEETGTVEEAAG